MNLGLINSLSIKNNQFFGKVPAVHEASTEGGMFLAMLEQSTEEQASVNPVNAIQNSEENFEQQIFLDTAEPLTPTAFLAISDEDTKLQPQQLSELPENIPEEKIQIAEHFEQASSNIVVAQSTTTEKLSTPLPVKLNGAIEQPISIDTPAVKTELKPISNNAQLAFLINDVSKELNINTISTQLPEAAKAEETPIIAEKVALRTIEPLATPALQNITEPLQPKKREPLTTKDTIEAESPKVTQTEEFPKNIALNIPQPVKILESTPALPKLDYVKLVPHKIVNQPKQIELSSNKPQLLISKEFESLVEPLVKSFEATTEQQPLESNNIESNIQLQHKQIAALGEYKNLPKAQLDKTVPQQISVNLMKSIENGKQSMTFKLQPADLGEVDIKFQSNAEGKTQITILSDKFTTFDSISKSVQQIENILTQHGFKQDSISIDVGLKEHSNNHHPKQDNNETFAFNNDEEVSVDLIHFKPSYDGLLNITI